MKNKDKSYAQLLDTIKKQENMSYQQLWDNIFYFIDIQKNEKFSNEDNVFYLRNEILSIFLTNENLKNFDYKNNENLKNLKKIDIVQLLEKKEENEIKFSNYISYHQEEYYKKFLLSHEFDEIPTYYVFLFSLYTTKDVGKSNPSNRELNLNSSSKKMIDYFVENNISKLEFIYSFKYTPELINSEKKFDNIFKIFEQTSKKNDLISAYLLKYRDYNNLITHKNLKEIIKYQVDIKIYDYFLNEKDHWSLIDIKAQAYMFSKVYILNYYKFTEYESLYFKNEFILFLDKFKNEHKDNIGFIFNSKNDLSLPVLEYYPQFLDFIVNDIDVLQNINETFKYLVFKKINTNHVSIDFENNKDSFIFKTLFTNMMLYSDLAHHKHIVKIYDIFLKESTLLEKCYLENGKPKDFNKTISLLYKDIENLSLHIVSNANPYNIVQQEEMAVIKSRSVFTCYEWARLVSSKEIKTIKFCEDTLLLNFFNIQDSLLLQTYLDDNKASKNELNNWLENCLVEILEFPLEAQHSLADSFYSLKEKLNKKIFPSESISSIANDFKNLRDKLNSKNFLAIEDLFEAKISKIVNNIEFPEFLMFDSLCAVLEEEILLKTTPKNQSKKKVLKF